MVEQRRTESPEELGAAPDSGISSSAMSASRADDFVDEVRSLKLAGGAGQHENRWLTLGVALMVVAVLLALVGAARVGTTREAADQRAMLGQSTLLAIVFVVAGAAMFLRYSIGRLLRFWLIRLVHEQRAQTDRIIESIDRAGGAVALPKVVLETGTADTSPSG